MRRPPGHEVLSSKNARHFSQSTEALHLFTLEPAEQARFAEFTLSGPYNRPVDEPENFEFNERSGAVCRICVVTVHSFWRRLTYACF